MELNGRAMMSAPPEYRALRYFGAGDQDERAEQYLDYCRHGFTICFVLALC